MSRVWISAIGALLLGIVGFVLSVLSLAAGAWLGLHLAGGG